MLKKPCKVTSFYYDSHDCNSKGICILEESLQASLEVLRGVPGRPFSAHLSVSSVTS